MSNPGGENAVRHNEVVADGGDASNTRESHLAPRRSFPPPPRRTEINNAVADDRGGGGGGGGIEKRQQRTKRTKSGNESSERPKKGAPSAKSNGHSTLQFARATMSTDRL